MSPLFPLLLQLQTATDVTGLIIEAMRKMEWFVTGTPESSRFIQSGSVRDIGPFGVLKGDEIVWFWIGPHKEYERVVGGKSKTG